MFVKNNAQVLSKHDHERANRNEYNFDHPDAFDYELIRKTLLRLKDGKQVDVPVYNFSTHGREKFSVCSSHLTSKKYIGKDEWCIKCIFRRVFIF